MSELSVCIGAAARDSLCHAFDAATSSIAGEFYDLKDEAVLAAIARARARDVAVDICTERHPHDFASRSILHAKAVVIDGRTAIVTTANVTRTGFASPGEVCIVDERPDDVAAVRFALSGDTRRADSCGRVIAGPDPKVRSSIESLFDSRADLRVASEDLSDERIIADLISRHRSGHADRVLINARGAMSPAQRRTVCRLSHAGVDVRAPAADYMHEKYVDNGDRIYVGSANLTRNGLDEACELGVVASASDFGAGAGELRDNFDAMWRAASPLATTLEGRAIARPSTTPTLWSGEL